MVLFFVCGPLLLIFKFHKLYFWIPLNLVLDFVEARNFKSIKICREEDDDAEKKKIQKEVAEKIREDYEKQNTSRVTMMSATADAAASDAMATRAWSARSGGAR